MRLWVGQSVSEIGSEITVLALPLTAVLLLHPTALQMGFLRAGWYGPQLAFGLFAGVSVDRIRRRPILITCDLGRAVTLAMIPVAVLLGGLQMWVLYLAAIVIGTFDTFFSIAYQSFLPSVVSRSHLVEGNSKLQTSSAIAQVAGPGLGGALIKLLTAPIALLVDSLSFLVSLILFISMRVREADAATVKSGHGSDRSVWHEIILGWQRLYADPLLRVIGSCSAVLGFFFGIQQTVLILYLVDGLHLDTVVIGVVLAIGSIGAIAGALVSGPAGARSLGPTLIIAVLVNAIGGTLLGLASGAGALPLLIAGQLLVGASFPLYFINQTSLRQAVAPPEYLGRVTAAFTVISWGMIPVGALAGGLVPSLVGLRATLVIGGIGKLGASLLLVFSPIRQLRHVPRQQP